ncbi:MAG: hypothetical protein JWO72_598 [Caulobacteraceae bacterium]|nr:hypothetical protein [Caulobacteraceae bacterium]
MTGASGGVLWFMKPSRAHRIRTAQRWMDDHGPLLTTLKIGAVMIIPVLIAALAIRAGA